MKAVAFKVPSTDTESFRLQQDDVPHFYDRLHHHPEIQLTLIIEGYGTQLVGDSIAAFREGDLLLIGAHLPHVFRNDQRFYEEEELRARSISVFFNEASFGKGFLAIPEAGPLRELLMQAERGIRIEGAVKEKLIPRFHSLKELQGFDRLLRLLEILNAITLAPSDLTVLSSIRFDGQSNATDELRLKKVFQHVMDHHHRPISLEEIAGVANMSTSAFCRYFKQRTRKTFIRFLNEMRVGAACRLLSEKDHHISEISYAVGFQNLSNFNRQFRAIKGMTPSDFVKKYQMRG